MLKAQISTWLQVRKKHLPHEAWHTVQQKQGRVKPTMQMKGKVNINDDSGLEKEADVMGAKALQKKALIGSNSVDITSQLKSTNERSFVVQRMKVIKNTEKGDLVEFGPEEEKPNEEGLFNNDGFTYLQVGGGSDGTTLYLKISRGPYQHSKPTPSSHRSYGTFGRETSGGGTVTPNPSKYFPQQSLIDQGAYGSLSGHSRVIGQDELNDTVVGGASKLLELKEKAALYGKSVVDSLRGPEMEEGLSSRTPLLGPPDLRVQHYKATHQVSELTNSAVSKGLSLATGGISGHVESVKEGVKKGGLGAELYSLADNVESQKRGLHSGGDSGEHSELLIDALKTLGKHFVASVAKTAVKAVPVIGSVAGIAETAAGLSENVVEAAKTIILFADQGNPDALKVANLLGIPREIFTARGGLEIVKSRLG